MPAPNRSGPCVAVVAAGKLFLVDTGSNSIRNLGRMGYSVGAVEGVVPCCAPLGDKLPQELTCCNRNASVACFNGGFPDWNGLRKGGLIDHLHRRYHVTTRSAHAERHSAENHRRHRDFRIVNKSHTEPHPTEPPQTSDRSAESHESDHDEHHSRLAVAFESIEFP